nr:hypothetical protein [Tanacetum cinerariifolium]
MFSLSKRLKADSAIRVNHNTWVLSAIPGSGDEGDDDNDDEDDDGEEGDDDDVDQEVERDDEEEGGDDEQEYDEEESEEETRDEESFNPISKTLENSNDEGNGEKDIGLNESSSVSSQFVTSMLNPTFDIGLLMKTLRRSSRSRSKNKFRTSYVVAADLSEMELKKILIEKMEGAEDQPIVQSSYHPKWFFKQQKPPTLDRDWNKTLPATHGSVQPWISELAKRTDSCSSFNELMDTPLDFSNFLINQLKVDTLTSELLVGLTYELMKGSCKSLVERYPHNLLKPLPLIPNNRGRRVIPFEHFINNDFEYLHGGDSSRKYTTSVTKTKAADYGHIKWIEDLFYGFAINRVFARDVYSKRRIIAVTELKIVEWHNYKHLDWITVQRDDDELYKFKEGDFKRLRIHNIEDMLPLLVQGELTNLTVEEHFPFNVSLRMFTRSIVIQRRVEDLQLGVESYQKKLNLTRSDTYCTDLKRKEAYSAYSNPRGFIYQNKDKKSDKDRAAAMIQAIDKMLKTRRIMRSLERVDTLTLELLARPTYKLIKRSCKSLIELEYHLEEVYKATTDQLDWVNLEGQQYPHNLLQPLPLIP